jgi:hypothetical protein
MKREARASRAAACVIIVSSSYVEAHRALVQRCNRFGVGQLFRDRLEQWLHSKIDECAEDLIVMCRNEGPRLEQFDKRERDRHLHLRNRMSLVGDDGKIDRAELLGERAIAVGHRAGAVEPEHLKPGVEGERIGNRSLGDHVGSERSFGKDCLLGRGLLRCRWTGVKIVELAECCEHVARQRAVLRQRRVDRHTRELQCLAARHRTALPLRDAEFVRGFDGNRSPEYLGLRRLRNRSHIRDVIEMGVADKDRVRLLHLAWYDAGRAIARTALEVGVEQKNLAPIDEFEIGGR